VVLFPERIGGQFVALHRPNPAQHFSPPEIWQATSSDLIHWGGHAPLLGGTEQWDAGRVGAGAPPLRTNVGWLEIYHGNNRRTGEIGVGMYSAGALLLDLENPSRILVTRGEILVPETDYERKGFVPNVVFPTGVVAKGETILVYYGAADESCAVVEVRLRNVRLGVLMFKLFMYAYLRIPILRWFWVCIDSSAWLTVRVNRFVASHAYSRTNADPVVELWI
jgi:predicted GH43/DUF377 family glycosyl hydrolase